MVFYTLSRAVIMNFESDTFYASNDEIKSDSFSTRESYPSR